MIHALQSRPLSQLGADLEKTYHIYHIPGKKIGVTRNLKKRVTEQQGFTPEEYEVLFSTNDIDKVSVLEIELQHLYGYPVDQVPYSELFKGSSKAITKSNQMSINATEQTSTFPCPLSELHTYLNEHEGTRWGTPQGYLFEISKITIPWILANAIVSRFNADRCFIYNKAFAEANFERTSHTAGVESSHAPDIAFIKRGGLPDRIPTTAIRQWAERRGIYKSGDVKTQLVKLFEEAGELAKAILKEDEAEFADAIGDCVVVLTNLAHLGNTTIEECTTGAWNEIKDRTGSMQNGTFVKTSSMLASHGQQPAVSTGYVQTTTLE